jgi:hypothetical protein
MVFEKVKKKYAICIICISLKEIPEPQGLASTFYHFEPDNNFAVRCMSGVDPGIKERVGQKTSS